MRAEGCPAVLCGLGWGLDEADLVAGGGGEAVEGLEGALGEPEAGV